MFSNDLLNINIMHIFTPNHFELSSLLLATKSDFLLSHKKKQKKKTIRIK